LGIGPQEGVLLGANLGCAIIANGDLTFAATRFSFQITLGTLVISIIITMSGSGMSA